MHYVQKNNGMYVLSRQDIDKIATKTLKDYSPSNLELPVPLQTTDFLENFLGLIVKNRYICDFESGILGLTVMGDMVPIPSYDEMFRPTVLEETFGTVLITPRLLGQENIGRRRYTEMHEASHFILHRPYFEKCERKTAARNADPHMYVICRKVETYKQSPKTDTDWLEYQADALAAALLMPRDVFCSYARDIMRKHGIYDRCIAVGPCVNKSRISTIISEVADMFRVSYRAAQIRMIHLGLIRECSCHF